MNKGMMSINEVNAVEEEDFEWLFGNVVELHSQAAKAVSKNRPFSTLEDLKTSFDVYIDNINDYEKESILLGHPDLASTLSAEDLKLTEESQNEQKQAGLDTMSKDERNTLINYLNLYREKMGFPFVICAKRNKVKAIFTSVEARLKNDKGTELKNGIEEVKKICRLRIEDLVWPDV